MTLYLSHPMSDSGWFCTRCGRTRLDLQTARKWVGNSWQPKCVEASNVVGFSQGKAGCNLMNML